METRKTIGCKTCGCYQNVNMPKNHSLKSSASVKRCPACGNYCGKPTLLDLFSGAGGAARGYQQAGFCVLGVDIVPQPRYAGCRFIQADALKYPLDDFDVIHASPPCQAYTRARHLQLCRKKNHPELIPPIQERLKASGKYYVIENVPGAPLHNPFMLCGTMFGLRVEIQGILYELRRHRLFESNIMILTPQCHHKLPVIGIYGHGESKPMRDKRGFQISTVEIRRTVMDMPWASRDEIAEAIPPAYTEFIGKQIIEKL